MAIIKDENLSTEEALNLIINNGDRKALADIVQRWGFRDDISALRFALAVLSLTKKGDLYQERQDGLGKVVIQPADSLMKD